MSSLKNFVDNYDPTIAQSLSIPESTRLIPGENYIANALIDRNVVPDFGGSITLPGESQPTTVTVDNLVSVLKKLVLAGKGYFMGNTTVNGKKGDPDEWMEGEAYGTRTEPVPTGEIKDMVDWTVKHFYPNTEFFNNLRANAQKYDIFMFTNKSVEIIRYDVNQPFFHKVGAPKGGDVKKAIAGKFSISYNSPTGELVPYIGIDARELDASDLAFTFGAPDSPTGLALVAGTQDHFTSPAGGGSVTLAVAEEYPVEYALFVGVGAEKPVGVDDKITVNTLSGLVTVASTMTAGRHVFTLIARNVTGIFGKRIFTIDKAAA